MSCMKCRRYRSLPTFTTGSHTQISTSRLNKTYEWNLINSCYLNCSRPFFTNINCHCSSFNRWIISKYYTLNTCNNSNSANATTTNCIVSSICCKRTNLKKWCIRIKDFHYSFPNRHFSSFC